MRPDLVVHPQQLGWRRYWVIKDPVALTYFHLRDEEHAILKMLNGQTNLTEIKRHFEQTFAPLQITFEQIQAFLARLHECGLLLAEPSGQGEQLLLRRRRRRRKELFQSLTSVLAIRLYSIDAEPVLRWLYPKCRWMFSAHCLAGSLLVLFAAVTLMAVQVDTLKAKLPDFYTFFNAHNIIWLAVALALAKVLHELAHALTCKHFGGECHELGIMLLVFTPCLYCNVSDSWMLSKKRQRIAIAGAGIYVEIILAAVFSFLWWFSEPGLFNTLCLNVMFVCSVSTVLFNGNPLLRYDGYFILSDIVEVPNLGQQSKALVRSALASLFFGTKPHDNRASPDQYRRMLAVYGVSSILYRWAVVIAILWFCYDVLEPYRLQLLVQIMAAIVLTGYLISPLWNIIQFFRNPAWVHRIKRGRVVLSCAVLAATVIGVCLAPLPLRIMAPIVLQPENGYSVYVLVPGTLVKSVAAGDKVESGETLAQLENSEIRMQVEKLTGQYNQQRLHLKNLKYRLLQDPSVGAQIPAAQEALADIEKRLRERQRDQQRLILTAPVGGTVLPPPSLRGQPNTPGQLKTWLGNPLDDRNLGCYLKTGTRFCLIGDPLRLEAVLFINQSDVMFVRTGQRVQIQLDELPGTTLGGTLTEIAKTDLKIIPPELAIEKSLPTRIAEDGLPRPLEALYQASVTLDDHDHRLLTGTRGRVKILVDPQPLGRRLYRYLSRTFSFGR